MGFHPTIHPAARNADVGCVLARTASLIDVVAALILFTALGAALVLVVAGANWLAGVPLFPLAPLFSGLRDDPAAYYWLFATLFSTIVPTAAHVIVAAFSLLILPFSATQRLPLNRWVTGTDATAAILGPLSLGFAATLAVMLPVLLLYGLYVLAVLVWPQLAQGYLSIFTTIAQMVGEVPLAATQP